ncbi:MAG: hypothetical protein Kow0059_02050 [Candidatus Sumerlaeia bacterium]
MKKILVLFVLACVGGGSLLAYNVITGNRRASQLAADIEAAKEALNTGNAAEAARLLEPVWRENTNKAVREKIGFMLFSAYQKDDRHDAVIELGEAYAGEFPQSEHTPAIKVAVLDARLKSGQSVASLLPELEKLAQAGDLKARNMILYHEAESLLEKGMLVQAREKFLELYDCIGEDNELTPKVEKRLGDLNVQLLFSPQVLPGDTEYTVEKGDYPAKVASQNGVPLELLMRCNSISDAKGLRIEQKLKIPKCDFEIIVDKSTNMMVVKNQGRFFKKYMVRTGQTDEMTPNGTYYIENKKKDPTWRRPGDGKAIPPGDPENELGTRWMSFWKDRLGIHGTIKPETIGKYSSQGCVGMLKEDVEELFDYIPLRTPVKIIGHKREDVAAN